jgi:hypothetical protein
MHDDFAWAGRIAFVIKHHHPDWSTNTETYRFPEVRHAPIVINTAKLADATLRICVSGPFGGEFEFIQPIGRRGARLRVGVVWAGHEVALYLDDEFYQATRATVSVH